MTSSIQMIDVTEWSIAANESTMVSYTATWCEPCQRIKPTIARLAENGAIAKISEKQITIAERKPGMKIPTFEILSLDGSVVIASIQTSKEPLFLEFFDKYSR